MSLWAKRESLEGLIWHADHNLDTPDIKYETSSQILYHVILPGQFFHPRNTRLATALAENCDKYAIILVRSQVSVTLELAVWGLIYFLNFYKGSSSLLIQGEGLFERAFRGEI